MTLRRADLGIAGVRRVGSHSTMRCVDCGAATITPQWVRRGGGPPRPLRLRVELTPLAQVWLAPRWGGAPGWRIPDGPTSGGLLRGADLRGPTSARPTSAGPTSPGPTSAGQPPRAYLAGANPRANLSGADLAGADPSSGADLIGANLAGAARYTGDAIIAGWTLRDGRIVRRWA